MAKGSYIGQVQIGETTYPVGSILYGVCETAAGTVAKVLSTEEGKVFSLTNDTFNNNNLTTGVTIHIKFTNTNSATNPTLKVGGADAKPIMRDASHAVGTTAATSWQAGAIVSLTYDGEKWVENTGIDSNTIYSAIDETNIKDSSNTLTGLITGQRFNQALTNRIDTSINNTSTDTQVPSTKAVYSYVNTKTSGLTGAMHFKGVATKAISDGGKEDPTISGYTFGTNGSSATLGDVVIYNGAEYVWTGTTNGWELLGDEGSYALKTSTTNVGSASGWSAGSIPSLSYTAKTVKSVKTNTAGTAASLTTTTHTIPYVTAAGSATTASVANGTLTISNGSAPTLGTPFSVKAVNVFTANTPTAIATEDIACDDITAWNAGTVPSLTITNTTVVEP